MHLVQCKNKDCTAVATISGHDVDIHSALDAAGCSCCPEDHHHGQAAGESGTPCRPVTIIMLPAASDLLPAGSA